MTLHRTLAVLFRSGALVVSVSLALHAQVDPRLMGDKGSFKTDFLDLLQRANDIKSKPEILTVFDTSGSMNTLGFHKAFPNSSAMEVSSTLDSDKDMYYNVRVERFGKGIQTGLVPCDDESSFKESLPLYMLDTSNSGTTTAKYKGKTMTVTGLGLVNPAGELVTSAMADKVKIGAETVESFDKLPGTSQSAFKWVDTNRGSNAAVNWVRAASHVRLQAVYNGITRVLDVPLPWAVLKMNKDNTGQPVARETVDDPGSEAAEDYQLDTTYLGNPSDVTNLRWSEDSSAIVGYNLGYLRMDYLFWLFFGVEGNGINANRTLVSEYSDIKGPWNNGIPTLTRFQALKVATIRTWFSYRNKVYWAIRAFHTASDEGDSNFKKSSEVGQDPTPSANTSEALKIPSNNATTLSRKWISLNFGAYGSKPTGGSNSYDNGVVMVSKIVANGGTPLTSAMSHALSQIIDTTQGTSHIFAKIGTESATECSDTVLILLTDGVPGDEKTGKYPYAFDSTGKEITDPIVGNKAVRADIAKPTPSFTLTDGSAFNIPTLAAMAAHLGNPGRGVGNYMAGPSKGYPNKQSPLKDWAPFAVLERGKQKFNLPRPILTMTIGMSLGTAYDKSPFASGKAYAMNTAEAKGAPKYRLLAAAHYGDPDRSTFNMAKAGTYEETRANPYSMRNGQKAPPTCFFDAADPDSLVTNLAAAFDEAGARGERATSSAPTVPYSGLGLGAQVYLASFEPAAKGPLWSGDLAMFPTLTDGQTIRILSPTGEEIQGDLGRTNASWSAAKYLDALSHKSRICYTRVPNGTTLLSFNPDSPSSNFPTIAPHFAKKDLGGKDLAKPLSDTEKEDIARFLLGASLDDAGQNRIGVLGDIIESSISVLDYDPSTIDRTKLSAEMASALAKVDGGGKDSARFRMIFVGTNTGFLHAFAEVSYPEAVEYKSRKFNITRGVIQELWSFLPTDFLAQIHYLKDPATTHRHLVDGTSVTYHLDLPNAKSRNPDGLVDASTNEKNLERAVLVFGLGKGGRSYYALNIRNPFAPTLAWTVNPDEAETSEGQTSIAGNQDPKGLNLGDLATDIQKMGFSTAKPAVGRVLFPHPKEDKGYQFRDVCFLSGGLSSTEMEDMFTINGKTSPAMGRLVLAVDVYTGKYMASFDLMAMAKAGTDKTVIDCVPAGVIPFEFFLGTGLTQRLYFMDYRRGLWSIGSGQVNTVDAKGKDLPFKDFRRDTSQMDQWKPMVGPGAFLRKVFTAPGEEYFGLLPAPFLVGTYPVPRNSDPLVTPAVTGIAISSGTKHNPMDRFRPKVDTLKHQLYMIFDRQDGPKEKLKDNEGIITDQLFPVQTDTDVNKLNPISSSYFLKPQKEGDPTPYYGYTLTFPGSYSPVGSIPGVYKLVPKALTEPVVLVGTLFYSYFMPGADYDPCSGGTGDSLSFRVCDVFSPRLTPIVYVKDENGKNTTRVVTVDANTSKYCENGVIFQWDGLATQFVARGTQASTQAGLVSVKNTSESGTGTGSGSGSGSGGTTTTSTTTVQIKSASTKQAEQWPRVRTWRSVYDY